VKYILKLCAFKEMEPSGDIVLFVERTNELVCMARLRQLKSKP